MAEEGRSSEFPECDSKVGPPSESDIGYIRNSKSVGYGHEEGVIEHLAPFSTGEFPNEETGEGKTD